MGIVNAAWFLFLSLSLSLQCPMESGTWQRVNTQVPIRSPRYAVFDLAEGKQYQFRVLSANIYGTSEPSDHLGPIETHELKGLLPSIFFLSMVSHRWVALVSYAYFHALMSPLFLGVPSAPGQVVGTRVTDSSVLIQWAPPKEPNNLIGYYIDQCVKGTKNWTSANHKPHKSTRFVFSSISTNIHCHASKMCMPLITWWLKFAFYLCV